MRKSLLWLTGLCLLAGPGVLTGSGAMAADSIFRGDRPSCDVHWHGMSPADQKFETGYTNFLNRCVQTCPASEAREALSVFAGRTHRYCDLRWRGMIKAKAVGDMTYRRFMNACNTRCLPARTAAAGVTGVELGIAAAGIAGAAAIGAKSSHGGPPASP